MSGSPSTLSPVLEQEELFCAPTYQDNCNWASNHPLAPNNQAKGYLGSAFPPYPYTMPPVPGCYPVDAFGRLLSVGPYGPYPPPPPPMHSTQPFPPAQPYPMAPAPAPYNGHSRPSWPHPPHSAYTYHSSPVSSRSTSPLSHKPSSVRSISPPPSFPLTPSQFIYELQQIRLSNRPAGPVGRFLLLGESLPVSVSQARKNGPFVIQHYLPDGRADVISIAHVFEFEQPEGMGEKGVIVWCPPPKVQYYGMNA
ncbi:hypothetical protein FRC07_007614 [Ceratobasidium sp. 392]|nr:hypothetical protein FRC07_007614 [Ceratobasidium sp. 392]